MRPSPAPHSPSGLRPGPAPRLHVRGATPRATVLVLLGGILGGTLLPTASLQAQDGEGVRWRNTSEFSFLVNEGNAVQRSLGLRNSLRRISPTGEFRLDLATLRTDAARIERRAVGTDDDFLVEEERETERTAERWSAQARYDRNLNRVLFAYGSGGWERNTFAGFNSRTILSTGAGARVGTEDVWGFRVGAGLTYTFQDDVDPDPDALDRFAGLRATLDYEHRLSASTEVEVAWVVDANAQEWEDLRGDFSQSVATSLTDRLALKTTFQVLWDNQPPLQRVPLVDPAGAETGSTVLVPLRNRDQVISVALVLRL